MKTFLLFLCLYVANTSALIPDELEVPSHSSFFRNYYQKYSKWFSSNIYNWKQELTKDEWNVLQESMSQVTHWNTAVKNRPYPSILWGVGLDEKSKKFFYILELAVPMESLPILGKKGIYKRLRISTLDNSICLTEDTIKWTCYNRLTLKFISTRHYSSRISLNKPFYMHKIKNSDNKESSYQYSKDFHIMELPVAMRKVVVQHGEELNLPLDKIEISQEKNFMVFYP